MQQPIVLEQQPFAIGMQPFWRVRLAKLRHRRWVGGEAASQTTIRFKNLSLIPIDVA